MREFGILLSLVAILIGIMLLVAPQSLVKLGEQTNRLYNVDGLVYRHRIWFGSFLVLACIFIFLAIA